MDENNMTTAQPKIGTVVIINQKIIYKNQGFELLYGHGAIVVDVTPPHPTIRFITGIARGKEMTVSLDEIDTNISRVLSK